MTDLPPVMTDQLLIQDLARATADCIAETATTSKVAEAIRQVIDKYVPSDVVQILLHDGVQLRLIDSKPPGLTDVSLSRSVCASAVEKGAFIILGNWKESEYRDTYVPTVPGMISELAFPIFADIEGERILFAVINLEHSTPSRFGPLDAKRVELVSQFAAALLRHADFAELSRSSGLMIKKLYGAKEKLSTNVADAIDEMVQTTRKWHHAQHVEVVVFEDLSENAEGLKAVTRTPTTLRRVYSYNRDDIDKRLTVVETACSEALECRPGEIRYYADFHKRRPARHLESYDNTMTCLVVPVWNADRVIGAIYVAAAAANTITVCARLLFKQLAGQLSPALELMKLLIHHNEIRWQHEASKTLAFANALSATHLHHIRSDIGMTAADLLDMIECPGDLPIGSEAFNDRIKRHAMFLKEAIKNYSVIMKSILRKGTAFPVWDVCREVLRNSNLQDRLAKSDIVLTMTAADPEAETAQASCPGFEPALYSALDNAARELIRVTGERRLDVRASVTGQPSGSRRIQIVVSDNGPGMTARQRASMFEARAAAGNGESAEPAEGRGFGMWFAKLCLNSSGGDVIVRENERAGTDIVYVLNVIE